MRPQYNHHPARFLLIILLGVFLSNCQSSQQPTTLRYGLTLAPSGLDPHLNASAELGIPLHSVYDTLVVRHPETGEFLPSLAMAWHISPDGRVYTFNLRHDVVFHDGNPFNAAAAVANFDYTVNPEHNSQKASAMLGPFKQALAVDEFTLQLVLQEPFAPLLDSLSQVYLGMASPEALDQWGASDYQFHQVGTGPYRFVEYIPNDHIILEKFADYSWGPEIYANDTAAIERIEFTFYEDPATRAFALERDDVDIIGEVPPQDALRLSEQAEFTLLPVPIPGQPLQYFLHTQRSPTDDLLVRRALAAGVDRIRITKTIFGDLSPIAKGALSAHPFASILPTPQVNVPEASALLEQAGWSDTDDDGILDKDGQEFQIDLIAPPWGSNPDVAQLIKADWEDLGAEVNLVIASSFSGLRQLQSENQYHAIGLNFFGTDADLLRPFYQSEGVYNWSQVQAAELDELLASGAAHTDVPMRNTAYQQAGEYIAEQALILPIRDYVNLIVHRNSVSNIQFSAQGWFPFLIDLEFGS
jgi:peptide/nickel transport system substrate-binding protein